VPPLRQLHQDGPSQRDSSGWLSRGVCSTSSPPPGSPAAAAPPVILQNQPPPGHSPSSISSAPTGLSNNSCSKRHLRCPVHFFLDHLSVRVNEAAVYLISYSPYSSIAVQLF
uniref:Uncharacterized protein n=1 Tax=Tetraodon nigroviridis TaxID=99883 RepID=H3C2A2_TETNG